MDKKELTMKYIAQFGAETLPPLEQMPPEQQNEQYLLELLERALKEGRPATDYIKVDNDPDVLY